MDFEPGHVVMLKSGGPTMTVVAVDGTDIACVWIGEEGALFRETLPAVALELIDMTVEEDDDDD
jgi:uncharacterized protein YodC (DUF2158 family)